MSFLRSNKQSFGARGGRAARRSLALFSLVALACVPGVRAPEVTPTRTLELGNEAAGKAASRPFAVVSAAPKGETLETSEISVVFNRPMRPLEAASDTDETPAPVRIVAEDGSTPPGHWRWLGTQAVMFVPEPALAPSTRYTVTVPAGTRALEGSTLAADYTFSLSTPRPSVSLVSSSDHLPPNPTLRLRFNQPVALREVEANTRLESGGKRVAVRASYAPLPKHADAEDWKERLIDVQPITRLALDSGHRLVVDKALRGRRGSLAMGSDTSFDVATYGPLRVTEISCGSRDGDSERCAPGAGFSVRFSNAVELGKAQRLVTLNGARPRGVAAPEDGERGTTLWFSSPLPPGGSASIAVSAGALVDEFGQRLGAGMSRNFRVGDLPPALRLGVDGEVFESERGPSQRTLSVHALNAGDYQLSTAVLDEAQVVRALSLRDDGRAARYDWLRALPKVSSRTVSSRGVRNRAVVDELSLDGVLGAAGAKRGVVAVGYRAKDVEMDRVELFRNTDLAVSAKLSRYGGVAWVTRLSTGAPVANAQVRIWVGAQRSFEGRGDDAGLVKVPADVLFRDADEGLPVMFVQTDDDFTYQELSDPMYTGEYPDRYAALEPHGMLFTERGVYKRGESVHAKLLFRQEELQGSSTPVGKPVRLRVTDADGSEIFDKTGKLGAFGEASFVVPVPKSAPLGSLSMQASLPTAGVKDDEDAPGRAWHSVQVAAYEPAEMKVAVSAGSASYVRGDKAEFSARAEYLYGAPLSGGQARFMMRRSRSWFQPPGAENAVVDDDSYAYDLPEQNGRSSALGDAEMALDGKGQAAHAVRLSMPAQHGAEMVHCEAEVTDVSRKTVASESSVLVHPGSFYLALQRPEDNLVSENSRLTPSVRAIEPGGKLRAGVAVRLELLRSTWSSTLEDNGGRGHWRSQVQDALVRSCELRTAAVGMQGCDLTTGKPGYHLLRATAKDERGNPLASSYGFYVTGSGEVGWASDDTSSVALVLDKSSYAVGQTAKLLIKSPFTEADALITVERANVIEHRRVHVKGSAPVVPIAVSEAVAPEAVVTVELLRGRVAGSGPQAGPAYRVGSARLQVDPEARRLKVSIKTPRTSYAPGDKLDADIVVTDRHGKGVETDLTFYAVDEGVLMLTGYSTPDPLQGMNLGGRLRVANFETRTALASLLRGRDVLGLDKGGDGGGGGGDLRTDFRTTAIFTSVKTDAQGRAKVSGSLPESLTTFRLMAVAAAKDDRFGFSESRVTTSRPLMLRPALPRFLRAGDQIEAGVVVSGKGLPGGPVEVTLTAENLQLQGPATQRVTLDKDGSAEVRFALRAEHVGPVAFAFRAQGLGHKDATRVAREVKIPTTLETVGLSGETENAVAERLGALANVRTDAGKLDLRLASTALVGVGDAIDQLIDYPHGCTEQLSSRLLPLVASKELASFYGVATPNRPEEQVASAVTQIVERQSYDGSFGYWGQSSSQGDPWLTAYAALALHRAEQSGFRIPKHVLPRAQQYLVQNALPGRSNTPDLALQAFALDVLAILGAPQAGSVNNLLAAAPSMPLFAQALLTHAVVASKLRPEDAKSLLERLEQHVQLTPTGAKVLIEQQGDYRRYLDSDLRTTAMVLRAMVAVDANHPLAPKLAKGLLAAKNNARYGSTQEAAWVLMALEDYRKAYENQPPSFDARVFAQGSLLHEANFATGTARAVNVAVPMQQLLESGAATQPLVFQRLGSGTLFYEARLQYAQKTNPTTPLARGFTVNRWLRALRPEQLEAAAKELPRSSATSAAAGDLVLVDLLVVAEDPMFQVIIDDPLPAGLQALDQSLATETRSYQSALDSGDGEERRTWNRPVRKVDEDRVLHFVGDMAAGVHHYRYLARAITKGRFVVPPTRVEAMYEPEVFGRTAGTAFEVR